MNKKLAKKSPKSPEKNKCAYCDYLCIKSSDFKKHLLTSKHIKNTNLNIIEQKNDTYLCKNCNKVYKGRNGLWYHARTCVLNDSNVNNIQDSSLNEIKILTNLVLEIVKSNTELQKQNQEIQKQSQDLQKQSQDLQKQNQEIQKQNQDLQKKVLDVCKNIQPSAINSNNTSNSHNKTFNLQLFLNEECKDAMNLNDFVESVQLQMADLEKIGELGYVEGVSKFIMGKLNETDVNKRPVHCSDAKRDTLYIKDDNVWTKEGAENSKIRGAVKKIEKKNIKLLNVWKETHTGCMDSDSPYNDQYTHMIIGSLGGCELDNVNKVIKKIAKATIIDK